MFITAAGNTVQGCNCRSSTLEELAEFSFHLDNTEFYVVCAENLSLFLSCVESMVNKGLVMLLWLHLVFSTYFSDVLSVLFSCSGVSVTFCGDRLNILWALVATS